MSDCYKLSNQLAREAAKCGEEFHDAYYLFDSYEDWNELEGWPQRSEHEDLAYDHFCEMCAYDRVREAFRAGLSINDPDKDWWDHDSSKYSGPTREHDNESDTVRWCSDCGKLLDFWPTDYCLTEELSAYEEERATGAQDLLILSRVLYSAANGEHESWALSVATAAMQRFEVSASREMRSRLPTWAKITQAFREVRRPIYLAHEE